MLVQATHGKQLLVGTPFNDAAVVHHQHLIGMLDGRQAVRDDQCGAFGHQALQRILHQSLGFVVQRGSGFVEDQDRGVTQDRAGDRQALALAAGQQRAVLADRGLQLLRHARDELPRIGCFGRRTDLLLARFHAIGDVGRDGVIEQHDLLPDHRHLPTQVGQRIVIQRDAIEGDHTTAGLIEARHQPDQAGLATAGTTHDGGDRTRLRHETDVVQGNAAVLAVAQHDVVEGQLAAHALHVVAASSRSTCMSRMPNRRSAAATPREIEVCTLVRRRSEGMMAIIEVIRPMNWPALRRPASASRVDTQTITASASAARNCTTLEAAARVTSTFMFSDSMRLARRE